MAQQRIRIGVVGANGGTDRWGARAHLPAIAALEEAELVAVCTAHEETAKRAQQRTGARLAFWGLRGYDALAGGRPGDGRGAHRRAPSRGNGGIGRRQTCVL